jgi:hypothetical protein
MSSKQASCLLDAVFLLALFFDHEDVGDIFLETSIDFQQTTRCYIPEDEADIEDSRLVI